MKTCRGLTVLAAALILAGCGQEQKPSPAAAPPPATAPDADGGYLGALVKGEQKAVKTIDVTSLNEELQLFNAQEGRFPKDLNELVTQHYLGQLPTPPAGATLLYDAVQGKVTVAPK
jgi:uncharacterized lipoprotein YajG